MINAEELYFELQKLKESGLDLTHISISVESSQNDEYFYLMKGVELNDNSNNLKIYFDDDREED